jgi:ankyrin repeat protein
LVEAGADIHATSNLGNTPLMLAADEGHSDIVRYLILQEAEIDAKNNNDNTALILASANGHTETVRALLHNRANPHIRNKKREQAHTLVSGDQELLDLLEQHRAKKKYLYGFLNLLEL